MHCRIRTKSAALILVLAAIMSATGICPAQTVAKLAADPLPSWNEGEARKAIVAFVTRVTTEGSPEFVPAKDRIATFDNDGTLWCEQPLYAQYAFAFDRARVMAERDPSLKDKPGIQSIVANNRDAMARFGQVEIATLLAVTHAGMTSDAFEEIAKTWLATAEHPRFHRLYKDCRYQPQLELLAYLREWLQIVHRDWRRHRIRPGVFRRGL